MNRRWLLSLFPLFLASLLSTPVRAFGLGLPSNEAGLGFGDLKRFDGIRLNLRDRGVDRVRGFNGTLWFASRNDGSEYEGVNLGLAPSGGRLRGLHAGLLGVGADKEVAGLAVAGLGCGAGNVLRGIAFGGLGCGAGKDVKGIAFGGFGCGAGEDVKGILVGGLGCGAGEDITGIAFGGLGCGAGKDVKGILVGGLGCGAGEDVTGIAVGGFGCGAGKDVRGLVVGGLGCGAGRDVRGIAVGGLGVSAGRATRGLLIAGLRAEASDARGILISAHNRIRPDGHLTGLAGGLWNQVRGTQTGVSLGLFNYARELHGLQLGGINWARDNPAWRRILPVVNW